MKASLSLYRRLLGSLAPYRKTVALSVLAMMAAAALEPVLPALLKPLVDDSLIARDRQAFWQIPALLLLAFIAKGLAEYVANVASQWIANRAVADLRHQVFAHQMRLPLSAHQREANGRMLSRLTYDIPQVGQALSSAWIVVIRDSLVILGLVAFLLWTAWELTLLIVVIAPVVAWLIRTASRKMRGANRAMQASMGALTGVADESIKGIREIKVFGSAAHEQARFETVSEQLRRETMRAVRVSAANVPLVQVLAAAAVSLVILSASLLSADDRLTPGGFVAFVTAMSMLFEPIRRLTNINATIQRGLAGAQSIFELLDTPPETDRAVEPALLSALPARARGELQLQAVRFRYPGQEGWALDGVSLHIRPGETVALVGASGSGKSSLIQLIPRFFAPEAGEIRLDGVALDDWPLARLRAQLALVSQQVVLFDATVAENIAYGRHDVPRERIEAAARAAHAWDFIAALPQGLDTPVGRNGEQLSGGQRQRLALARAFLKDAPILLLDEATSALDNESERMVKLALAELRRNRTVLVVAHRLSTVQDADRIVVMEHGRIVESGRHAELLAAGGAYARLLASGDEAAATV